MSRPYNILDKLVNKAIKPPIVTRIVTGNIVKTAGRSVTLTAPSVEGYTFVCWVTAITNGWTGYVSPANPTLASVGFWVNYVASPTTSTGEISAIALYRAD